MRRTSAFVSDPKSTPASATPSSVGGRPAGFEMLDRDAEAVGDPAQARQSGYQERGEFDYVGWLSFP
jgi:hypothetical protein